jgi:hypothetical protein
VNACRSGPKFVSRQPIAIRILLLVRIIILLVQVNRLYQSLTNLKLGISILLLYKGDTCFKIAEANGITIKKLYAINPGLNCYGLEVGRRVCVPSITYQTATISYEPAQKLMYKPTVLPYKCICYYQIGICYEFRSF